MACMATIGLNLVKSATNAKSMNEEVAIFGLSRRFGNVPISEFSFDDNGGTLSLSKPLRDYINKDEKHLLGVDDSKLSRSTFYDQYIVSNDIPARSAVEKLGRKMGIRNNEMPAKLKNPDSGIPAAYTYFGQFIAHDLSKMSFKDSAQNTLNWRSAALDLQSIYWDLNHRGPHDFPSGTHAAGGVALGKTYGSKSRWDDLPRESNGVADIPEERNDFTVAVAQVHVLLSKFHQTIGILFPNLNSKQQRSLTLRYFHSVVLFDYLPRISDPDVYRDVMVRGRSIVHPRSISESFRLPIEFAAAAFRFGHSMVRDSYPSWRLDNDHSKSTVAYPSSLAKHTSPGGKLINGIQLDDDWRTRWQNLIDLGPGFDRCPHTASAVDTVLSTYMTELDPWLLPNDDSTLGLREGDRSIMAIRTLVRGQTLKLASGEELAEFVRSFLEVDQPDIRILEWSDIVNSPSRMVKRYLQSSEGTGEFKDNTPLWFYILCEADHYHRGQRLGPLGSRIVVETIHASIEASQHGLIQAGQFTGFQPDERISNTCGNSVRLRDIIDCVSNHWIDQKY